MEQQKLLTQVDVFLETDTFMMTIQDQIIMTKNYCKFIIKKNYAKDVCRRCAPEKIQRITGGCKVLYIIHDQIVGIIHEKLANLYNLNAEVCP